MSCFLGEAQITSYQDEHAPKFMTGVSLNIIMGSTPCTAAIKVRAKQQKNTVPSNTLRCRQLHSTRFKYIQREL